MNTPLRIPRTELHAPFKGKRRPVFAKVAGMRIQIGWTKDHRVLDTDASK
jgi:hypothetical protein